MAWTSSHTCARNLAATLALLAAVTPDPGLAAEAPGCLSEKFAASLRQLRSETLQRSRAQVAHREERLRAIPPHGRTVFHERVIETELSRGPRHLFRKRGGNWQSVHGKNEIAPDGDPRWPIVIFGDRAARFFGVEMKGADGVVLPGAQRLNRAIEEVNAVSPRARIGLRFYEVEGKVSALEYLERFAEKGELPISDGYRLHDTVYHAPAILIPPGEIELARAQTRTFVRFIRYLTKEHPELAGDDALRVYLGAAADQAAFQIDGGTGNFTAFLSAGAVDGARGQLANLVTDYSGPREYLRQLFFKLLDPKAVPSNAVVLSPYRDRFTAFSSARWGSEQQRRFRQAFEGFLGNTEELAGNPYPAGLRPLTQAEFESMVEKRRRAIMAATLEAGARK